MRTVARGVVQDILHYSTRLIGKLLPRLTLVTRGNIHRVGRYDGESAEDWYDRTVHQLQAARADEDRHRRRLQALPRVGLTAPVDNAYMDAVDHAELAQSEVLDAERAVRRERSLQEEAAKAAVNIGG